MDHVAGVWVVDDVAFGTGTMISPASLKKHVFSWYRKVGERCHAANRLFMMHSDGDLSAIMDDLIDMELDVIQPIDPSCMDMAKVKKQWGERICLIGNVSNELLRSASTAQIEARVKELLRAAAPGGGFALGSGNSVPNWAKYENYLAMRESGLKHGSYPISIK
jgi:uroporphyrinogen decarboxylase